MSKGRRFFALGSPLHGKDVPRDWGTMTPQAQRRGLVAYGYAKSYEHACSLMGQHSAAVVRGRRERMEWAAKARHPEGKD